MYLGFIEDLERRALLPIHGVRQKKRLAAWAVTG